MNQTQNLLAILMEECAEVAQRASKGLRFTMDEVQPDSIANPQGLTNDQRLAGELNDLLGVVDELRRLGYLRDFGNAGAIAAKVEKIRRFTAYSRERGCVE